jgi:hypothetical protein
MSATLTFTRRIRVDGVLTDADSAPLLTDADATYGVKRLDTGAVVVAHETVAGGIDHDGTGLYSYTLTAPTPGVTYEASFKFVVGGRTSYSTKTLTAVDEADHYGSRTGIEAHGLYNADVAADIESTGDAEEIEARFETALTRADGIVRFEAGRLNSAAADLSDVIPASTDTTYYPEIAEGANTYALGYLMQGRGEPVAPGKVPAWQQLMDLGRKMIIDALKAYNADQDDRPLPGTFQFIPVLDPTLDADEYAR